MQAAPTPGQEPGAGGCGVLAGLGEQQNGVNGPEGLAVERRKSPGLFVFNGTVRGPSPCRHRRRWLSLLRSVESHGGEAGTALLDSPVSRLCPWELSNLQLPP